MESVSGCGDPCFEILVLMGLCFKVRLIAACLADDKPWTQAVLFLWRRTSAVCLYAVTVENPCVRFALSPRCCEATLCTEWQTESVCCLSQWCTLLKPCAQGNLAILYSMLIGRGLTSCSDSILAVPSAMRISRSI